MATLLQEPRSIPVDATGAPYPGAKRYIYQAGSTTPLTVYTDSALTTAHAFPQIADANGVFAPAYLPGTVTTYRRRLTNSADVLISDLDNIATGTPTSAEIGELLYPQTAAEQSAGVTPTFYAYPPGDVRRYGVTGNGTTDDRAALNTAKTVGISLYFPAGTYRVASALTLDVPCTFDKGAIIKPDAGVTVTFAGDIDAGWHRIFDVTNAGAAIKFTALPRVRADWFGAKGDNATVSGAAVKAAIAALPTGGAYYGGRVEFGFGQYLIDQQLQLPNGVGLVGQGVPATFIKATNTFNAASLIRNTNQDGTQSYAYLEGLIIDGNKAGGAVCSTAVVDFVSLFVNSYIRDCLVQNGSKWNLHIGAAGNPGGGGPFLVENSWFLSSGDHNIVIDETAGNVGAVAGITLRQCTVEHQPAGRTAIYVAGLGKIVGVNILDCHIEQQFTGANTFALYVDGVADVKVDGFQVQSVSSASGGIVITSNAINARYTFRNVTNINVINPILTDNRPATPVTFGGVHVPFYCAADIGLHVDRVQTLTYGATVNTDLTLGNFAQIVATNNTPFTIANPTNAQVGEKLTYEITNASGGAMGAITWGGAFAFRDASFAAPANGNRRTITFVYRGSNWVQVGAASGDM